MAGCAVADFQRFANRSRLINLMLTTVGTAAAVATYYDGRSVGGLLQLCGRILAQQLLIIFTSARAVPLQECKSTAAWVPTHIALMRVLGVLVHGAKLVQRVCRAPIKG